MIRVVGNPAGRCDHRSQYDVRPRHRVLGARVPRGAVMWRPAWSSAGCGSVVLAQRWESAGDVERADLLLLTWLVHRLIAGPVTASVVFGWGLPLLLAGITPVSQPGYSAWFN